MNLYKKSRKAAALLALILSASMFCAACSSGAEKESAMTNVSENEQMTDASTGELTETVASEENMEMAVEESEVQEKELEPEPEEEQVVEEDTNLYGSTTGNIYNNGVYAEYEDGKYFMRNREGQVYIIDPADKDNVVYLNGMELYEMSYSNGKLYGILSTQNEQLKMANDQIMVVEIDNENKKFFADAMEERRPEYMYVVNDMIYYSDSETHKLIRVDPETEEETVLVEDEIYYPSIYKDRIIFQNDGDGESLYSIPLDGGKMTKLNDMRSYWPIVYRDKIYYQGVSDAAYTLRCMKLDGSGDKELAGVEYNWPVLCGDKFCFIDASDISTVSYLDLSDLDAGIQKLDISDKLVELLSNDEEVISSGIDMSGHKLCEVSNLSYINGCLMFWTFYIDDNGSYIGDNAKYDFEKGEVDLLPYYYD